MKLFYKFFVSITALFIIALTVMGYLTVKESFANSLEREKQSAVEEFGMIKFTLKVGVLSAYEGGKMQKVRRSLTAICMQAAGVASKNSLIIIEQKNTVICAEPSDIIADSFDFSFPESDCLISFAKSNGKTYLCVLGPVTQNGVTLNIALMRDLSIVLSEKQRALNNYTILYIIVVLLGIALAALLAYFLTAPIKRLTRTTGRVAAGNYTERANITSKDEIGDLSRSFDAMTQTVQDKISELEDSARQKEDFVAAFAHELKTPLTSVIGYSDMLYQKPMTRKEVQAAAGFILNEGMRLEALSIKLLDLIVMDKHEFSLIEMPPKDIIADIADTMRPIADKRGVLLLITADIPENSYVCVEYDLLKTLIINLLDNAFKAGARRTVLSCKADTDNANAVFTVTDNGCGIPEGELTKITEAFYMVDKSRARKQHGAGLGLALSARIAELHNTRLMFKSAPDVGTSVSFSLPLHIEPEDDAYEG